MLRRGGDVVEICWTDDVVAAIDEARASATAALRVATDDDVAPVAGDVRVEDEAGSERASDEERQASHRAHRARLTAPTALVATVSFAEDYVQLIIHTLAA